MTPSPARREIPQAPVRPSRPASTLRATGTAEDTVKPVRQAPVAPERQFSSRREMRLAQRAAQNPAEAVSMPSSLPAQKREKADAPIKSVSFEASQPLESMKSVAPEAEKSEKPVEPVRVGAFWEDVDNDLKEPEFKEAYEDVSVEIMDADEAMDEAERLREENATEVTGMQPVSYSDEELRLRKKSGDFMRLVGKDDFLLEIIQEPNDEDNLDEDRIRSRVKFLFDEFVGK